MNNSFVLIPAFEQNNVAVCFASDNKFAPYCAVAIKSLIDSASDLNNYDVVILDDGVSEQNKQKIISLAQNKGNISIRFFNIEYIFNRYDNNIFYTHWHFSRAAYNRLFTPEIFAHYQKVLYLDSDIIILDDIAKLFQTDVSNKVFGVMPSTARFYNNPEQCLPNYTKHLENFVKNRYDCYNSAVLLLNIPIMIEKQFTKKCLDALELYKTPQHVDQDLLNIAFPPEHLSQLDPLWAYTPMYKWLYNGDTKNYTAYFNTLRVKIKEDAKLIHYLTNNKPWKPNSQWIDENKYWWSFLSKTPFFEQVLSDFMADMQKKLLKLENYEKQEKSNA